MNENPNESIQKDTSDSQNIKAKEKKIVIIILSIMAGIVMLSIPVIISSIGRDQPTETTRLIYFVTPDFNENIFDDPEYLGLDRLVEVKQGSVGTKYDISSATDRAKESKAVNFMFDFIEAQIMGDADAYNACFSEDYIAKNGRQAAFTMQKLYDVSLEQYKRTELEDGVKEYTFILRYKILDNNGTLRRDVESHAERPLYLLVREDEDGNFSIVSMIARS